MFLSCLYSLRWLHILQGILVALRQFYHKYMSLEHFIEFIGLPIYSIFLLGKWTLHNYEKWPKLIKSKKATARTIEWENKRLVLFIRLVVNRALLRSPATLYESRCAFCYSSPSSGHSSFLTNPAAYEAMSYIWIWLMKKSFQTNYACICVFILSYDFQMVFTKVQIILAAEFWLVWFPVLLRADRFTELCCYFWTVSQ